VTFASLDREGIFKARPLQWRVYQAKEGQSVAIAVEYRITAQLDGKEWSDWSGFDEVRCWGRHNVIKRDGTPNTAMCQQLAISLGWGGSLREVVGGPPPDIEVQITVKAETYNGQTSYKADWINPGDYVPQAGGADEQEVGQLEARFGSLLKAAASKAKTAGKTPPKIASKTPASTAPFQVAEPSEPGKTTPDYGDIPF
jgi:hypothetical protein